MNLINLFNIPNIITIFRALTSPLLLFFYFNNNFYFILYFSIFLIITDFLDGFIARKFKFETEIGGILDPIGDKILTFIIFYIGYLEKFIPYWFFIFIIFKDLLILISGFYVLLKKKNVKIKSKLSGKISMIINSLIFIFIIINLFKYIYIFKYKYILFYLSFLFSIITLIDYSRFLK